MIKIDKIAKNVLKKCIKYFGTKSFDICISCENWSVLKNGKCEKIKKCNQSNL